jgi:uncharacterized protein (UPF0128 family)
MKIKKNKKDHLIRTVTVYGLDFDFFMTRISEIGSFTGKKVPDKKKSIVQESLS